LTLLTLAISILALLATFYQLYLQRVHNEKSLKPLGQVDLYDSDKQIHVYISNKGMGPMTIERVTFTKNTKSYDNIEACLDLDPKTYNHILLNDSIKKVILPGSQFQVFETVFDDHDSDAEIERVRNQLAPIILKVDCRDIYDNKFSFERKLDWFSRHAARNVNSSH
jgi:hypothetical protein